MALFTSLRRRFSPLDVNYLSMFLFWFCVFSHHRGKKKCSWMFKATWQLWWQLKQSSLDRQQQVEGRWLTVCSRCLVKHITVMTSTASRCRGTLQRHNAWRSLVSTVSKQKPLWGETDPWFGPFSRSWWFKPGGEWLSNWIWGKGSEKRSVGERIGVDSQNGNMAEITVCSV